MKIKPVSEWHEDLGASIFIRFSRDEEGQIRGEPPEVCFVSGYLDDAFNMDEWEYYLVDNVNTWFEQAEAFGDKLEFKHY